MSSLDNTVLGQYELLKPLSSGTFGTVYQAKNTNSKELVAVKVSTKYSEAHNVFQEIKILTKIGNCQGIPKVLCCGSDKNINRDYLVQELLGRDLWSLLEDFGGKFTMKTTLLLAVQIIDVLENLHSKFFIHRDIKPDNFMIGRGENANTVYLIDFGFATKYKKNGVHVEYCDGIGGLLGNSLCSSINAHLGIQQSRRDDMEAVAYMLVLLLKGSLLWQYLQVEPRHLKYELIGKIKASTTPEELCEGLPQEFADFIKYSRALEFEQEPDYMFLRQMFLSLLTNSNSSVEDNRFDWSLKNQDVQGTSINTSPDCEKSSSEKLGTTLQVLPLLEVSSGEEEKDEDEKRQEESYGPEISVKVRGPIHLPGTNLSLKIIDNAVALVYSRDDLVQIVPITR